MQQDALPFDVVEPFFMHKPSAITQTPIKPQAEGKEKQMEAQELDNVEEETTEEVVEEVVEETTEEEETEESEESEVVKEAWMDEDEDSEKEEAPKFEKALKAKKKLKGVIDKQDTELETLRAENKALKSNKPAPAQSGLVPPDEDDYDTREEYQAEVNKYNIAVYNESRQQDTQAQAQREMQETISTNMNAHYDRAEILMEKSGIAPEKYKAADTKLRQSVEDVLPGKGNAIVDGFLSLLGEGSEKVGYYVGNNEAARTKFQGLLIQDPTGLKAAMFLGTQNNRLNNPKKQTTNAKAPAPKAKGDVPVSNSALKKKYDNASKAKDGQAALRAKLEAKAAGVDTSKW